MIRLFIFSDLHYDDVPDGDRRVEKILAKAAQKKPDCIISLGDLCRPCRENRFLPEKFRSLGIPFYPVIGNHETDHCTTGEICSFYALDKPYYALLCGDYKLIFLNTCYLLENGREKPYYQRNFRNASCVHPILPGEELRWLEQELGDGKKYILFSHHSLINDFAKRGVANREEVRKLFRGKDLLLCLNGHDHGDGFALLEGIPYMTVNSANYAWLGAQIAASEELQARYGHLHGILPYKQAMCVYLEIDAEEIRIRGEEGSYLSVTPDDIGLHDYRWNGVSVRPRISSRVISLKKEPTA